MVALLLIAGCAREPTWPDPPPEMQQVILAEGYLRLGDPVTAAELLAAMPEPAASDVWALRVGQDVDRALLGPKGALERAQQRYDEREDAVSAYLLGRALLPDGDAARPLFEEATQLEPTFAWGHIGVAQLEVIRGDMFQAIQVHEQQLRNTPDDADLLMSLGLMSLDVKLLRDAEKAFRRALEARSWDPRILGSLGQTLGQFDREVEAAQHLERALSIDPSRTDLMGSLAYVRFRAGHLEQAWDLVVRQQEVDGSADAFLRWNLEMKLDRELPHFATLGPRALDDHRQETPGGG